MELPLLPVVVVMILGRILMSKMIGFCNQGMIKCIPSPITVFLTPAKRSNMTARSPPSTLYMLEDMTETPIPTGNAQRISLSIRTWDMDKTFRARGWSHLKMKPIEFKSPGTLADEWKKIREDEKVTNDNAAKDTRSLYERLKEQRAIQIEEELEATRSSIYRIVDICSIISIEAAVRTLESEDLEFLNLLEEESRKQETERQREVLCEMERIRSKTELQQPDSLDTILELKRKLITPAATTKQPTGKSGMLQQKNLLKASIIKKKK